jgi:hypothetical protein
LVQDRNGQTAIFKAAIKASNLVNVWKINDSIYLKTIKELLKHPIDINIQDKNDKYFYDYLTNDQLQDNEILMIKNIKKYNI